MRIQHLFVQMLDSKFLGKYLPTLSLDGCEGFVREVVCPVSAPYHLGKAEILLDEFCELVCSVNQSLGGEVITERFSEFDQNRSEQLVLRQFETLCSQASPQEE